MSDLDCTTCGGCCVADELFQGEEAWVNVSGRDKLKMTKSQRLLYVLDDEHGHALKTKEHDKFGTTCACLNGEPGEKVSCVIYKNRPNVCRKFPVGSPACLKIRAQLGKS